MMPLLLEQYTNNAEDVKRGIALFAQDTTSDVTCHMWLPQERICFTLIVHIHASEYRQIHQKEPMKYLMWGPIM